MVTIPYFSLFVHHRHRKLKFQFIAPKAPLVGELSPKVTEGFTEPKPTANAIPPQTPPSRLSPVHLPYRGGLDCPLNWDLLIWAEKYPYVLVAHRGMCYLAEEVERRDTSWYPPSTMEVEDTRVSLAFCCRSGILVTPTLHMVDLTLYRLASTLSCREPAYVT